MALSKEVRETVLAKLADPDSGLNAWFVRLCREYSIPIPAPGMGGAPDQPFDFSPGSMTFFQTDIDINQLEQYSQLQYPCVILSTPQAQMFRQGKVTPLKFSGLITVDLRVYLSWADQEPPPGNNSEIYMDAVQRSMYEIFNGPVESVASEGMFWGDGMVYSGDLTELPRERMTPNNEKRNWRRGCRFQMTVTAFD